MKNRIPVCHLPSHSPISSQHVSGLAAVFLFIFMLLSPKAVFSGAQEGLLLWFQVVFPTLFPFMLISSLMMEAGGLKVVSAILGNLTGRIFSTSENGAFAVLCGFLCGYPMGAKITADLVRKKQISRTEGQYLLSFCNNTSPVFIINFIVWKTLQREDLMLPTVLILMGVPILVSFPFRKYYLHGKKHFPSLCTDKEWEKKRLNFSVLDSCMMNSFEGIVKVGGYIIFFSVLLHVLDGISSECVFALFLPMLEMTNGILRLHETFSSLNVSYPLIIGLATFGGFCSLAQTQCMIEKTGLSVSAYLIQKLTASAAASLFAWIYIFAAAK